MSDIIRGANDPTETATATRAKGQFASIRLRDMQDEVSRFVRDTLRIMGEVMAEHFGIETLARISGVDLPTEPSRSSSCRCRCSRRPDDGHARHAAAAPPAHSRRPSRC
jgi:hypothetical protein